MVIIIIIPSASRYLVGDLITLMPASMRVCIQPYHIVSFKLICMQSLGSCMKNAMPSWYALGEMDHFIEYTQSILTMGDHSR